mgnify:CR=1 FL=1
MRFGLDWIIGACGGTLACGPADGGVCGFAIDSRHKGDAWAFVALKGERADGHDYLDDAYGNGARVAIVSRIPEKVPQGMSVVLTEDPLLALGSISGAHRRRFGIPVIGITGSAGKTTTKDMTAAVLATKYRVLKTKGNLNGEIGCPLTLLEMDETHEYAVIEMAMRGFGQIKYLTELALPKKGIVTIVGSMHMEFLGSREGIAKAKAELVEALPEDGLAILNRDDAMVYAMKEKCRCPHLTYGTDEEADIRAVGIGASESGASFDVRLSSKARTLLGFGHTGIEGVRIPFAGDHQVRNALAAACAGLSEGIEPGHIKTALAGFKPSAMRMSVKKAMQGYDVLDDTYNANPESVPAALASAMALASGRPVYLVLGGMVELGERSLELHHELGAKLARQGVAGIVTMGELGHGIHEGLLAAGFEGAIHTISHEEAAERIASLAKPGSLVLVKGSRAIGMDKVVSILTGITESPH